MGSIPQGEREPSCAQSQSREAWTSLPTWARGPYLFPGLHCLAKPSLDSSTLSGVCTLFPSVSPHEGPQKTMRRNEGVLSGEVCLLSHYREVDLARQWQLWDPVPVHPKAPAHCTPDSSLAPDASLISRSRLDLGPQLGSHPSASLSVLYSATPKLQASCSTPRAYSKLWLRAEALFTRRLTTSLQAKPARMHPSSTCPGTTEPRPRPPLRGIERPSLRHL